MRPLGLILAGGKSRRMGGGDKALAPFGGAPMLQHVIDRLAPQCSRLLISANGDPARFAAFGLLVVPDSAPGFLGPLAGVLAGLEWAEREAFGAQDVVTLAADTPFAPHDLVQRLLDARRPPSSPRQASLSLSASRHLLPQSFDKLRMRGEGFTTQGLRPPLPLAGEGWGEGLAVAASGGQRHHAVGLWPVALADPLRRALVKEGLRKVETFTQRYPVAVAEWPALPLDPFFNVNTSEDLAAAEARLPGG